MRRTIFSTRLCDEAHEQFAMVADLGNKHFPFRYWPMLQYEGWSFEDFWKGVGRSCVMETSLADCFMRQVDVKGGEEDVRD